MLNAIPPLNSLMNLLRSGLRQMMVLPLEMATNLIRPDPMPAYLADNNRELG